jgi:two-component system, OmpR family, phosphate regulon sensor histidine kinase PhoR
MPDWIVIRRLMGLTAMVCGPLALIDLLGLMFKWHSLEDSGFLAEEITLHVAGLLLVGGMAWWGGWRWQRRLERQVDTLLDTCRRLALGEPAGLPEPPERLDELGRLGLGIQVLREALVDYLSLYRRFFDVAPDMFLSIGTANFQILDANQAFCQKLGLLPNEVRDQPVGRFVTLEQPWDEALRQVGQLHKGQVLRRQGNIDIEASLSLEHGPGGQPWVLGLILRDVSLQKALVDELLKKSTALEKALQEIQSVENLKDQFLTTLSHELKTPMVSLKGFLQLIMQERIKPEDRQAYLEICWRNLLKLENQINNLLDLARLSHAKDQYEMGPVDLCAVVRTEAENLRLLAEERKVRLELGNLPATAVMVLGNKEKLIQLVDNLLLNAVKYNVEGGEVRLGLEQRDQAVVLVVSDSGLGMAREHMAKIFNRFYQANLTGTGRLEGLGIGLSLVQEIVLLHQGDIRVESEPGLGTTFTVILESLP